MRMLLGLSVGLVGALASYVIATKVHGVGEAILGPTLGMVLAAIVGLGGLGVMAALVYSILWPNRRAATP